MTNPYVAQMRQWRQTLTKDQRWAILISADPDALASALALKRIMAHRVRGVDIFRINEVTRPDNLAMIRYLRIPAKLWQPEKADLYTNFAMVDSQPHHNPAFQGITFDLIIDHHPLTAGQLPQAPFCDIRPGFGATSTMMTRYLQGLRIKPGPLLSTALLYGIRTDTATFERSGGEDDLRAYQWLIKHADATLLRRIIRSEYLRAWLPLFSRAFRSLRDCRGGAMVWLNEVDSADLLVAVADFFTRVHGLKWIAVCGVVEKTVVVIFRGDGSLVYNGGGIAARYTNKNGVYTEGSLRAGMLKSDMDNALRDGAGNFYGYESESAYYGAHIGIGKIISLSDSSDLDIYGKFFHTYTDGDSFSVGDDKFEFDDITSDRLRVGARLTTNKENAFSTYYGLAYEYEFNGDADMKAAGMSAPEQSLQGSSYMAEIGLNYQPTPDSPWSLDLNMRGYAGEREGASFNVQATYTF